MMLCKQTTLSIQRLIVSLRDKENNTYKQIENHQKEKKFYMQVKHLKELKKASNRL